MIIRKTLLFHGVFLVLVPVLLRADTKTSRWQDSNSWHLTSAFPPSLLQRNTASISTTNLKNVLQALHPDKTTAGKPAGSPPRSCPASDPSSPLDLQWGEGDTFLVHVVAWAKPTKDAQTGSASSAKIQIDKQNWYVYQTKHTSDEDLQTRKRFYGVKRFWLVYIHVQIDKDLQGNLQYDVAYEAAVKGKTPVYLNHLEGLLAMFQGGGAGLGAGLPPTDDLTTRWGAHCFDVPYVPSDVTLSPHFTQRTGGPAVPAGTLTYAAPGADLTDVKAETFDNEGLYWFDFSVGVPLKKIKDIQYVSASNTIVPASVDKENVFALTDVYFRPVDIKGLGFSRLPHFVAGAKIGSQPLKKALIGIGYGPALAHFYFGLVLNTTSVPKGTSCGSTPPTVPAGTALENRTCPEFGWGLNVSVGAAAAALKKK